MRRRRKKLLKVRWQDGQSASERVLDVDEILFQDGMLVFKSPAGRMLLVIPQDRLLDAQDVAK